MTLKAAVLGASGFIGGHTCGLLLEAGVDVIAVSSASPTPIDLSTPDGRAGLARLLSRQRPEIVVNLTGKAWQATEADMYRVNSEMVGSLVEMVGELNYRPRLVHVGSVHEYGLGRHGQGFRETDPPAPVAAYGRSKLLGTTAVLDAAQRGHVDAVALRVSNVAGPGTPAGSLLRTVADRLELAAKAVANGEEPEPLRYASLAAWRDFIDVRDVAAAIFCAATAPAEASGQLYNVGQGRAVQMRTLVHQMVAFLGLPVRVLEDNPDSGGDWQQLDTAKARDALRWKPEIPLDRSLRDLMYL